MKGGTVISLAEIGRRATPAVGCRLDGILDAGLMHLTSVVGAETVAHA